MRTVRWLSVIGRLAPGVTPERARRDLVALQGHLAQTYPDADEGWTDAHVEPLLESIVGNVRPALLILFAAAACVLLVASVNIAALLLARASVREREFALRAALGAGRGRILQQVLTESLLLALLGALLGIVVAAILIPVLLRLSAGELPRAPRRRSIGPLQPSRWRSASCPVWCWPAHLRSNCSQARLAPHSAIPAAVPGARPLGCIECEGDRMLVAAEVAIAVVLVCGASLMAKSFRRLLAADTGFRPDSALVVGFHISGDLTDAQFDQYYETVLDRVRQVPGVVTVGAAKMLPLQGLDDTYSFGIAGQPLLPVGQRPTVTANHVSPDYFRAVGTPLLRDAGSRPPTLWARPASSSSTTYLRASTFPALSPTFRGGRLCLVTLTSYAWWVSFAACTKGRSRRHREPLCISPPCRTRGKRAPRGPGARSTCSLHRRYRARHLVGQPRADDH